MEKFHNVDFRKTLREFKEGKIEEEDVLKFLKIDYIEKIGGLASLDIFREERTGIPEVIFGQTKSSDVLIEIVKKYISQRNQVLISRLRNEHYEVLEDFIKNRDDLEIVINKTGRIAKISKIIESSEKQIEEKKPSKGKIGLITAGTSDIPIAEEAKLVAEAMGCEVISSYDVGIAGFHRIFDPLKTMLTVGVNAIIVIAGMEGTLPGVVSSLVDVPVIGVPTSNGYGFKGKGEGALTTMLQSCSPGLTVVNIDNGFGAGASAALIAINSTKNRTISD